MTHDELVTAAIDAIRKVFTDRSVSQEQIHESLDSLRDEIDVLDDAL